MTRRRIGWIAGTLAALLVLAVGSAVLVVRSEWFFNKVRVWLVGQVETATGGRVEAGSFRLDWKQLRAELRDFTLHGTEGADKPPLFHAPLVAVGLKILSVARRDVDIQYLEVAEPRVFLIVYPDGHTNVPEPKVKGPKRPPVETLLSLAVGRFDVRNGTFEVESRSSTPFDAQGRNLNLKLQYEASAPRYRADVAVAPLNVRWPGSTEVPLDVQASLAIERNRLSVLQARIAGADSRVELVGAVDDWTTPRAAFQYRGTVSVPSAARVLRLAGLERGTVDTEGRASWSSGPGYAVTGTFRATGVNYRDSSVLLANCRANGNLSAHPGGIDLDRVRFAGASGKVSADGTVASIAVRGEDLDLRGIVATAVGGEFRGDGQVRGLDRFAVHGEIASFAIKPTVALYSDHPLPWDGLASGTVSLEGSFRRKSELQAAAELEIAPAAEGTAVNGHISAKYEARSGLLDLGRSTIHLPSSRADFSGSLPATKGRELRVHFETRDLNDVLPAIGESVDSVPVKLENGGVVFDGTVTGNLEEPRIAGHLAVSRFVYETRVFEGFAGDVQASPESVEARNAAVSSGGLRPQFQGSMALDRWKIRDTSTIAGNGSVRNADVAVMAEMAGIKDAGVSGTVSGSAEFSGTVASPVIGGDVEVVKGVFREEPFDRFRARVGYSGRTVSVANGEVLAGSGQVRLSGSFDHAPDHFDTGRLRFQVNTNPVPVDRVHWLEVSRPGVKGTVQVEANGDVDLAPARNGTLGLRISGLHADVMARQLQLSGQPLGDAHLTADSQSGTLHAHLESNIANSTVKGDGQWRLEGNYDGSGTITFSKLDFNSLRPWIEPGAPVSKNISGSAEGEVRVSGPVLQPEALKAELRVEKFDVAAAVPAPANSVALANSGPIVATLANSVLTVDSARLVGRGTDLSIAGKVQILQKNALDLRVTGHVQLDILHDFNRDVISSGAVAAEASVRGPLDAPQINGRLEFQNAAFSIADLPNGISNATGVILLTNDVHGGTRENRATIQSFTGETGGGKVALFGFAAYGGDEATFRVHARANQVRVRYPEGVSTVADANLDFTGTTMRSQVSGTITILRTGINLQSDFSSILAQTSEPVQTPAARTGLLGGMNFDIQVDTAPDIQFQSSLTEDLEAEASLRLRGTFSNPAVVGRINLTQGQVIFYGTKYTINQGSISFFNPLKVEPILDIDLETKARGIDITLSVAGPANKLHLTPRSDPPLQFNEIVALLATGRTPTSDPTMLTQQSTQPQSWEQMGASALLGQAIANPVAGRLQRFFGVSKLRIDPTITGVENNPQARLTLEQQITPAITFTYITNVTSTNPQVVRMEWAFGKQWSAVALREENGTFGLDFFYKRRF